MEQLLTFFHVSSWEMDHSASETDMSCHSEQFPSDEPGPSAEDWTNKVHTQTWP